MDRVDLKSFILNEALRLRIRLCPSTGRGVAPFNRIAISLLLSFYLAFLVLPVALAEVPDRLSDEAGQIVLKQHDRDGVIIGEYYQYLPAGSSADYRIPMPIGSKPLTMVVLVHGSINSDQGARTAALNYLNRYKADADSQWFAVIAPVFNQTDFGGDSGPLGGYRGMIGRHRSGVEPRVSDADGFVNAILDAYQHKHPEIFSRKALFYGHSAGGQFLSRYLVTHPDRVAAMVISSAGTYPFPDRSIRWTDGMDSMRRYTISWGSDRDFEFYPSESLFKRAARLPVTVMVGDSEDCTIIPNASLTPGYDDGSNGVGPCCPEGGLNLIWYSGTGFAVSIGPCRKRPEWSPTGAGTNHMRGRLWVQAMQDFAGLRPSDQRIEFESAHNVRHSSAQTQPLALPILMSSKPSKFNIDWLCSTMAPELIRKNRNNKTTKCLKGKENRYVYKNI